MSRLFLCLSVLLGGCLPNLSPWRVEQNPSGDAGIVPPGSDAGPPGDPNPVDLGPPCPNPHLVVSTVSGDPARVVRIDPTTDTQCRTSPLVEVQRDFGDSILDVDWHPETGELLGLDSAVLALDAEGFPRWRYQRFDDSSFDAGWVVPVGSGAAMRIGVFWLASGSDLSDGVLLDSGGNARSADIELPFAGIDLVAAHPDGSARFVMSNRYSTPRVYSLTDATVDFETTDGVEIFPGMDPTLSMLYGNRAHLAGDPTLGLLAMTHAQGVLLWDGVSATPPTALYSCPSLCSNYSFGVAGPAGDVYAVCTDAAGAGRRHLVHMRGGDACSIVIDGTSFGTRTLNEIVLAHAAL